MNVKTGLWVIHKKIVKILSVTALLLLLLLLFKATKVKEIMLFVCGQPISYKKDIGAGLIQPVLKSLHSHWNIAITLLLLLPFLFFCVTHYFSTGSFCGQLF
jgi:hypothetical protein